MLADWVICYRNEAPTRYGYPENLPVVYEDSLVRVYRYIPPAAGQVQR